MRAGYAVVSMDSRGRYGSEVDWPGAFRPGRRIKWWLTSMAPDLRRRRGLPPPHTPAEARQDWAEADGENPWTEYLPWLDFPRPLAQGLAEYARDWLEHPNRRPWRLDEVHGQVEVPNLDFSGWYDHCNGSMRHLQLMQRRGRSERARSQTKLIAGPWNHPGLGSRAVAGIDFGPQAGLNLPDLIIRWFDHWLKGIDNGVDREPAVRYFVMAGRRGRWRSTDTWPPAEATPREYRLGSGGDAGFGGSGRLEVRGDILCYRTEPLAEAVEIAGYLEAVLFVSLRRAGGGGQRRAPLGPAGLAAGAAGAG